MRTGSLVVECNNGVFLKKSSELYLADKQKHESETQNQTLTDLIRKAHEEKEVDTRTKEEIKEDTKRMTADILCYLGKEDGQQVIDRATGYYEEHCR